MGRWVRTPGDHWVCAGQPPRVPKPGQQVSRFPFTVAGGYLENRNRLGLLYFPPDDQRESGRETILFFPSGWDASRSGVGVCYPMPGVSCIVMTHTKSEIGAVSEPWQSARLADSTTWVTGP